MEMVNKSVRQINERVHSSNEIITEISDNTKKMLHEQGKEFLVENKPSPLATFIRPAKPHRRDHRRI
ncbi:MAG: hypothetical protein LBU89_04375, partial [Fibromonadaceae bacterium]|nr:hypothetical protein [Fibromonadaceae bacterium]